MRVIVAISALLVGLGCMQASGAPRQSDVGLFDRFVPRPLRAILNGHRHNSAVAPVPRPKPQHEPTAAENQSAAPAVAPAPGPITFPPVAPLE
jgi:hypothetical protein